MLAAVMVGEVLFHMSKAPSVGSARIVSGGKKKMLAW
jgi:hypothetical protein